MTQTTRKTRTNILETFHLHQLLPSNLLQRAKVMPVLWWMLFNHAVLQVGIPKTFICTQKQGWFDYWWQPFLPGPPNDVQGKCYFYGPSGELIGVPKSRLTLKVISPFINVSSLFYPFFYFVTVTYSTINW